MRLFCAFFRERFDLPSLFSGEYLGSQHPDVADSLHHLAKFHQLQQHTTEALSLYQQALTIREKALGSCHPHTKTTRTAYTQLLCELGREEEAATIENQGVERVTECKK
ncbi:MAG: tetratricopeptide repeat protein [Chloroflexi bacterium]|nr:tetratricopeptide repeat protein [Chloroflexota bacterium]